MNKTLLIYSCVLVLGVFISNISQIILKKSANKKHDSVIREYLNPYVIGAYAIFFAATFMSIFAYKVVPLTMGPILESTGYFFMTILGYFFLKEQLNTKKAVALCIIVAGIVIYSL